MAGNQSLSSQGFPPDRSTVALLLTTWALWVERKNVTLNYRVRQVGDFFSVQSEWGIVPALYSTQAAAELLKECFTAFPTLYWPIRYQMGLRVRTYYSPEFEQKEQLHSGGWSLFLPKYSFLPWFFRNPGNYPTSNLFPTQQSAFEFSAQKGELNVIRIPRHKSRFLASGN